MKKAIIAVVALVLVGVVAFGVYTLVLNNPEKRIIGKWMDEKSNYGFEFKEDGSVSFPIEFFNLGFEADIDGKYTLDTKKDTITFTFSFFSISYEKKYDFVLKGDTLTLTNDNNKSTVFYRQTGKAQTQATSAK
ncbi:MAG: DUF5640 domain-containing protein [Acutalibacteraceae bacterium]